MKCIFSKSMRDAACAAPRRRLISFIFMLIVFLIPVKFVYASDAVQLDLTEDFFTSSEAIGYFTTAPDYLDLESYPMPDGGYPVYCIHVDASTEKITKTKTGYLTYDLSGGASVYYKRTITRDESDKYYKYYKQAVQNFDSFSDKLPFSNIDWESNADHLLFYAYDSSLKYQAYVVIEWEKEQETTLTDEQLKPLSDLLATVSDDTTAYYQSEDRYNGNSADTITDKKSSLWTQFTASNGPREKAQKVLKSAQTEDEITLAVTELQTAINKLIPTTEVNATALYEQIRRYDSVEESDYTAGSWAQYLEAKAAAETMLASLYDAETGEATALNWGPSHEGTPSENAITQEKVDAAVAALTEAKKNLLTITNEEWWQKRTTLVSKLLPQLITQAESAKEADYTAESWIAFQNALSAAKTASEPVSDGTWAYVTEVRTYQQIYDTLYSAYYYDLATADSFTVQFEYTDSYSARKNRTVTGVAEAVEVEAGSKVSDLVEKYAITYKGIDGYYSSGINDCGIMINGVLVSKYYSTPDSTGVGTRDTVLHPGDQVCLIATWAAETTSKPTIALGLATLYQVSDSAKHAEFKTDTEMTAEAGKAFTVSVEEAGAYLSTYTGSKTPSSGMTLYISDPQEQEGGKVTMTKMSASGADVVTDADGNATITVYKEGWYLLQAFDLTKDVMGDQGDLDYGGEYSKGDYHSANSGASTWIYVSSSANPDLVKADLQKELDEVYGAYPESYFRPETWEELKTAYETGTSGITAAATVGDAYDAQQTAVIAIQKLQSATTKENETALNTFRSLMAKLPEDVEKLSASTKSTVDALITCYEGMSDYQKSQLTGAEVARYNKIKEYADSHETFDEVQYQLNVNIEADTEEAAAILKAMTDYLHDNPATQDRGSSGSTGTHIQTDTPYAFSTTVARKMSVITEAAPLTSVSFVSSVDYSAYFQTRDAGGTFTVDGADWSISDSSLSWTQTSSGYSYGYTIDTGLTVTVKGVPYEIKSVTYQGIDEEDVISTSLTAYDDSTYNGKDKTYINMKFADAASEFVMPYNDVTVTVLWGPVDGSQSEIDAARTSALAAVKAVYEGYDTAHENYAAITAAYETGVQEINAATSLDAIAAARKNAVSAMQKAAEGITVGGAIEGWGEGDAFDAGNQVGTVTVMLENTTYDDGYFYYTNWTDSNANGAFIMEENYPLGENDNMMTVVLRALADRGGSWSGTGGDGSIYNITYLSSVTLDNYKLGEFDGGSESGWMGTLNDFFVNESLSLFTVKDGKLGDGDVISIMYTSNGLGADIGGTWDNSDTTLKSLEVEGGTLTPDFTSGEAGGTYSYTLVIDSSTANLKLTPTASNKNFLSKIFLNEKVTDNTEGGSFYKRTETIPVTSGDVIYVGCGIDKWPSMNNQMGNTQDNDGTWYVLNIMYADDGSDYVENLIAALPDSLSYEKYPNKADSVEAARAAYDALSKEAQEKVDNYDKLTGLEKTIESFRQVDEFKKQLAALPDASRITLDDSDAVAAVKEAYDKLSEDQQQYLTAAEKQKVQELVDRIDELEHAAAEAVDQLIDNIGEVTLDSETAIKAARTAYEALTPKQQGYVKNLETLKNAEAKLQELQDAAAAKTVEDMINELPAAEDLTLTNKADVAAARDAYDKLSGEQQKLVSDDAKTKLEAAEAKLKELEEAAEKEAADRAAAEGVENKINALPAVGDLTVDNKSEVDAAKAGYDNLSEDQKAYVSDEAKQKLDAAAAEIARLEEERDNKATAEVVEKLIDAIGEVTLESKPAIDAARKAYDQLTDPQKNFISEETYKKLTDAESQYKKLADEAAADYVRELIDNLGDITLDSRELIQAARAAYDGLTDDQKGLISEDTYKKLTDAEDKYAKLADEAAAAEVREKIESIGNVTKDSKTKIEAARAAYDLLTDSQKALVSQGTYKKLTDAEAAYQKLLTETGKDTSGDKGTTGKDTSGNKGSGSSGSKGSGSTGTKSSSTTGSKTSGTQAPATGDTGATAWLIALSASAICVAAVVIDLKKRRA